LARIVYRLQPWAFVDRLVQDVCPAGFEIVPLARDASPEERRVIERAPRIVGEAVGEDVAHADENQRFKRTA